jgi:hypothetical protein
MVEYNYTLDGLMPRHAEFLQGKLESLKNLKEKIKGNILPDRQYTIAMKNVNGVISEKFQKDKENYKSDWQCSYCNYKNICWEKEIEEIKENKFYIKGEFEK